MVDRHKDIRISILFFDRRQFTFLLLSPTHFPPFVLVKTFSPHQYSPVRASVFCWRFSWTQCPEVEPAVLDEDCVASVTNQQCIIWQFTLVRWPSVRRTQYYASHRGILGSAEKKEKRKRKHAEKAKQTETATFWALKLMAVFWSLFVFVFELPFSNNALTIDTLLEKKI